MKKKTKQARNGIPVQVWLSGEVFLVFEDLRTRNKIRGSDLIRALLMNAKGKTITFKKTITAEVKP
jgi:hypothetical protein